MVILKGPMHSDDAHGSINKNINVQKQFGTSRARMWFKPKNVKSQCQLTRRSVFLDGSTAWSKSPDLVTPEDKVAWRALAKQLLMTGYNLFMQKYIQLNLIGCTKVTPAIIPKPNHQSQPETSFLLINDVDYLLINSTDKLKLI
jgi:hypothetical protein